MTAQILTDPERLFAAWLIVACVVLLAVACWREVVAQNRREDALIASLRLADAEWEHLMNLIDPMTEGDAA